MSVEREQLQVALRVAAQIVARDGEAFLPIFLRLEAEVKAAGDRMAAIERAASLGGEPPAVA